VRTFSPKQSDITRAWHLIDAEGMVLGRLASEIARVLRGKHKPIYAPHVDTGDFVVVVNAAKIAVDPKKGADKRYYRHSQYPGGLRSESLASLMARNPERVLSRQELLQDVWGWDLDGDSNVIEVTVSHLRRALEERGEPRLIHTVRPVGYILKER